MTEQTTNPLLERIRVPGETFRLPSGALFYKNDELSDDVENGEVHVLPMTTIDELAFKSPDKLFSGQAVAEVFARRIPQIQKPMDLLSKDVDYLMMCLRLVSYGEQLELTVSHHCQEEDNEHSHNVAVREVIRNATAIDPTATKKFKTKLENDQVVILKPPSFKNVLSIYQNEEKLSEMDEEEIAKVIFENLSGMIEEVDGISDRELIEEWLSALKPKWITDISNSIINVSNWGVQPSMTVKCPDCEEDFEVEVPTNPITFFT